MTTQTLTHEDAIKKIGEALYNPIDLYCRDKDPSDLDLISHVRERMVAVGLGDRLPLAYDQSRFILEAQGRPSHAQQYHLNRYFSMQLMAATVDTSQQRFALIYEVNSDDWLRIFESMILPAIVEFDLPVVI